MHNGKKSLRTCWKLYLPAPSWTHAGWRHTGSAAFSPAAITEHTIFEIGGSTNGFGAYATFVPEAELGVVMLAHTNIFMPDRLEAMYQALEALAELAK